jgi:small subunit ribosomal protein S1
MSDDRPDDTFAALFEQSDTKKARAPRVGERVSGKVLLIGRDAVFVEVEGKREAFLDLVEMRNPDGTLPVKVGDVVTAQVVSTSDGQIRLRRLFAPPPPAAEPRAARATSSGTEGKGSAASATGAPAPAPEPTFVVGSVVRGKVERIETYGVFVQIDGTRGRGGRGLVPNVELGVPRGTDLHKTFPVGTPMVAVVLETGDRKLRLSVKAAKDAEERADFEESKSKAAVPKTLGTLGDLLKNRR